MADATVTVNSTQAKFALQGFSEAIGVEPILKIFGAVMRDSVQKTFREQGSPAGSWPALAPSTIKSRKFVSGDKILIRRGLLLNSVNEQVTVAGHEGKLVHGTNLKYAAIQNSGGFAGRKTQSPKSRARGKKFRRPFIPARQFIVFRPEDPQRMTDAAETFIQSQAKGKGL
jgi:phage gpG-like protein